MNGATIAAYAQQLGLNECVENLPDVEPTVQKT
jgi:hypothetical protein